MKLISPGAVAFTIGGFDIMWYGVLIGSGFLIAAALAYYRCPLHKLSRDKFLDDLIIIIPTSIIGARAYYVIFEWERYAGDWKSIFDIRNGGLAIHGGLLLPFLCVFIYTRFSKESYAATADLIASVIPFGQALGRWGNFFNEEAHGIAADNLPISVLIDGVEYHPTFLYESVWCALLFVFLIWFDTKKRKFDGQIISLYMMLYSFERFFVEGLRTDSLWIGSLRQAQVISIEIFVAGLALYFIMRAYAKKKGKYGLALPKSIKEAEAQMKALKAAKTAEATSESLEPEVVKAVAENVAEAAATSAAVGAESVVAQEVPETEVQNQ